MSRPQKYSASQRNQDDDNVNKRRLPKRHRDREFGVHTAMDESDDVMDQNDHCYNYRFNFHCATPDFAAEIFRHHVDDTGRAFFTDSSPGFAVLPRAQLYPTNFSAHSFRQGIDELNLARIFVRRGYILNVILNLLG